MKTKPNQLSPLIYGVGNSWQRRHNAEVQRQHPVIQAVEAWRLLCDHYSPDGELVGDDGYTGPLMEDMGRDLHYLLSADIGDLDGGTMSGYILAIAERYGLDIE